MASIRFEFDATPNMRWQLEVLGTVYTETHDKLVVHLSGIMDVEALFLLVKGVTSHGMTASLPEQQVERPKEQDEALKVEANGRVSVLRPAHTSEATAAAKSSSKPSRDTEKKNA